MRIKEGSSRPGDARKPLLCSARKSWLRFVTVHPISVWSDDDWLKKFSGKTLEEAEAEAQAGETSKTTAQEVSQISLHALTLYLLSVCFLTVSVSTG